MGFPLAIGIGVDSSFGCGRARGTAVRIKQTRTDNGRVSEWIQLGAGIHAIVHTKVNPSVERCMRVSEWIQQGPGIHTKVNPAVEICTYVSEWVQQGPSIHTKVNPSVEICVSVSECTQQGPGIHT